LVSDRGDQIGRIFANWAILYFGQFFENHTSSPYFGILCSTVSSGYASILTKYVLGNFSTNSSGHPVSDRCCKWVHLETNIFGKNIGEKKLAILTQNIATLSHTSVFRRNAIF
jgi:hypothetical protein